MTEGSRCPPSDALQQLTQGQLPEAEAASVERHLSECAACAQTVGMLLSPTHAVPAMGAESEPTVVYTTTTAVAGRSHDFLAPPQEEDELGRLGSYRVLKVLGEGGMGMVFLAEDTVLERPVALKVMKPDSAVGAQARQRFLQEGKVAAALQHDHIVTIYQVGEDRGVPFLAMQFLQGESLDERLKREKRLSVPEILRIGREVAEGLGAAHERGLIHRDIKPANIWLERVDDARPARVKLLDFGLARIIGDKATHLTRTGMVMGTPDYMAPEQARGLELDHRCDLFSLGCVLYHLCTGQKPFHGEDVMATLLALTMEEPIPIRQINPDVPWALEDRIKGLMAKAPADRPKSARAVVDELRHVERALAEGTATEPARERERNYIPASRRKCRKESPSAAPPATPPATPPRPPAEEPTLPFHHAPPASPDPTSVVLEDPGLQAWGEGTRQSAALPVDQPAASATLTTPLTATPAPSPATDTNVCPRCGSKRFSTLGAGWCQACGYTPGSPLDDPNKKSAGEASGSRWLLRLFAGVGLILLLTALGNFRLLRSTQTWNFWILTQMGTGLALLLLAHIWTYVVVWPFHDTSRTIFPLWCTPLLMWRLALRMHQRTRRPLCLAAWALTASLAALYVAGDPLFFVKSSKMKMKAPQASLKKPTEKSKEVTTSQKCVVIGYEVEDDNITGIVLAVKKDGELKYAGVAHAIEDNAGDVSSRLSRLRHLSKPVAPISDIQARWVEPKINCTVKGDRDSNDIIKEPIIIAWE